MMEILCVLATLMCVGSVVYFRLTDARNVSVQTLQNYLKQSEKHIESMLNKKEKLFNDRMIESEIVIDRMHKLASTLKEKIEHFDRDIIKGDEIFDDLKNELNVVQDELYEYKQIRSEFRDIEDRIGAILNIKKQAEDGTVELNQLRNSIQAFKGEYEDVTEKIKVEARSELDEFYQYLKKDLNSFVVENRQKLADKDVEITMQINQLSTATGSLGTQIQDFKDYAQTSVDQLKKEFSTDLEMAKNISDSNVTDIYDMWEKLKDQTKEDKEHILNTISDQKEYFETAEQTLREDISQFNKTLSTLSEEIQTNLHLNVQEKSHELDKKITDMHANIEQKGEEVQKTLSEVLETQTTSVRDELDRLRAAFAEQEQSIEDRVRVLGSRVNEGLSLAETSFQKSIVELQDSVDATKNYSNEVLQEAQKQIEDKISIIEDDFKEKANENMLKIEESFKETNQNRVAQSIDGIVVSLENEFKQQYQSSIDDIFKRSEDLEEIIKEKMQAIDTLDKHLAEINEVFNNEKEKIILMSTELEKDREQSADIVIQRSQEYMEQMRDELTETIQQFIADGSQNIINEQEAWKERYNEILNEGRNTFYKIEQDVEGIRRFLSNLEDTSLTGLKREADRINHEAEYRMEDIKNQISELFRNSKNEFFEQMEQARDEVKNLRQDLWNQEKEIQQLVEKDLERFSTKSKDVDKQFQIFLKKAEKLDQVEDLMRKLNKQQEEASTLKEDLNKIHDLLKESHGEGQETIQRLTDTTQELQMSSSEADRIQEQLVSTIEEANQLSIMYNSLKEEKEKAQQLEDLLHTNLSLFNDVQDSLNQLENRRELVEEMQSVIEKSETNMNVVTETTEDINNRINEMNEYAQEIQGQLQSLQSEMKILAGDQTKFKSAVSKLEDLEHMSVHIDTEMKRLDKMRDWIAKVNKDISKQGFPVDDDDDNKDTDIKNIHRLHEMGWSIDDIAKNLKLTSTYVELIIDRYRA